MKKIDWYILKKYLLTFLFCLVMLSAVVLIIDLSEKTDDFAKSGLPASKIITDYYFGFLPHIDAMLFPLFAFISVIFFTSLMANRSEVIAILSSGVSFKRFLLPFFVGGSILSGILFFANKSLIPKANQKWSVFDAKYINFNYGNFKSTASISNYYFRLDSFSYAGIRYYDTTRKNGNNFFVQKFKDNKLIYNLRAENITWDTTTHKWRLDKVIERFINDLPPRTELIHPIQSSYGGAMQEVIREQPTMQMSYSFKPRDLQRDEYMKDKLTTSELNEFIELEKIRGAEDVNTLLMEKHERTAIPVSVLILTLIGAILASRKIRGGSGFHLAIGVVISVVYILVGRFAEVFAVKGNFDPVLAAWTPNVIFGLLVFYLYKKAPK